MHKFLKFFFDLAELPMVSLGQEPLGGANHSQKTSKSGGVFPANHFLEQEIPFGKIKTPTNYKTIKKICNFDKNALFNRFLFHNKTPGKKTSLPGTKKDIRFSVFRVQLHMVPVKHQLFKNNEKCVKTGNLYTYNDHSGILF